MTSLRPDAQLREALGPGLQPQPLIFRIISPLDLKGPGISPTLLMAATSTGSLKQVIAPTAQAGALGVLDQDPLGGTWEAG